MSKDAAEFETAIQQGENFLLLSEFLNAIAVPAAIIDEERRILSANPALFKLFGIQSAQLGKRPGEYFGCPHSGQGCGKSRFCASCGLYAAMISGLSKGCFSEEDTHLSIRRGDHEHSFDCKASVAPLRSVGKLYLLTIQDISHEKRRRVLERIFFHDVMNSVAEMQALLRRGNGMNDGEMLDRVKRLAEDIRSQRDLLDAEKGELTLNPAWIFGDTFLAEAAESVQAGASASGKQLRLLCSGHEEIFTDHRLLRRVLTNMLINAYEASEEGTVIRAEFKTDGRTAEFIVSNPAVMSEQVKLQVFERSFSTKGEGRGLGTYSIKLLTERYLKGSVSFTSEEESGTTFVVRLPKELKGAGST